MMKIYLDFVFIINFFFDFLLLYATAKILKKKVTLKRLFLGAGLGSLTILILFVKINSLVLFIIKFLLSVLIILVTFGKKDFKNTISYFYILSIILGGALYLLDITFTYKNTGLVFVRNSYALNIVLILIVSPLIIYTYIKDNLSYKSEISNKYLIKIIINDKEYELEAILDTGNTLTDPYKKRPVILIDKPLPHKKKILYVPYLALNTTGVIPCITPDKVIINEKVFNNCLLGLSKDKFNLHGASCILPNKFKEDLC